MSTLASLNIVLEMDAAKFSSGMGGVTNKLDATTTKLKSFGKSMQGIGRKMSLGVTTPLLAIGTAAFSMASDLDESLSKTDVVFGESAAVITNFAATSATSLGLAQQEALESAASFGNMFNTIGLAQSASTEMSTSMVQLAADMASFNNEDPSDMLLRLRSGLAGEAEPLRQFGVLLSESAVQAKAMEMGLGDANGALTEAEKVQARYALILEQTSIQQGDFARTSEGAANSTRIAQAALKDAAATLGQELLPAGTKLIQMVTDVAARFSEMDAGTRKVVVVVGGLAAAVGPVLVVLGTLISSIGTMVGAFGTVIGIISGGGGVVAVLGLIISPVGLIVAVVAGLALAWRNNWGDIQGKTRTAIEAMRGFLDGLKQTLSSLGNPLDGIKSKISSFADSVKSLPSKLPAWLRRGSPAPIELTLQGIAATLSALGGVQGELPKFSRNLLDAGRAARSFADAAEAFRKIFDMAETFGGRFPTVTAGHAFENLRDLIKALILRMQEIAGDIDADLIPEANAVASLGGRASQALAGVASAFKTIYDITSDEAFGGILPAVTLETAFVNLRDLALAMAQRMIEIAQALDQDLLDSTSTAMEAVNKATSALAGVVDALSKLVDFGALEADIGQMQRDALAGAARVILLLKSVALAISGMFHDPRFIVAPIEEGVQALLDNWGKAVGPLSGAIDGIGKLIDFSQLEADTMQMQRDALAGAARMTQLLKAVALAIAGMFRDSRFAAEPISEEAQALLNNWSAALSPLTSAADAIDKIINTDLSKFEDVMVTRLVAAMQSLARAMDQAVSQLESESAGILDRLKSASEKLAPLGDAISSLVGGIMSVFDLGGAGAAFSTTRRISRSQLGLTLDPFLAQIDTAVQRLETAIPQVAQALSGIEVVDIDLSWFTEPVGQVTQVLTDLDSSWENLANAAVAGIANGIRAGMAGIDAAFQALLNDIYAWVDALNAALAEIPQPASPLPELQGMIDGIRAAVQPMAAAWGEVAGVGMAAPVPAMASVGPAGGVGAQTIQIHIENINGTDREAARQFGNHIRDELRRNGVTLTR